MLIRKLFSFDFDFASLVGISNIFPSLTVPDSSRQSIAKLSSLREPGTQTPICLCLSAVMLIQHLFMISMLSCHSSVHDDKISTALTAPPHVTPHFISPSNRLLISQLRKLPSFRRLTVHAVASRHSTRPISRYLQRTSPHTVPPTAHAPAHTTR